MARTPFFRVALSILPTSLLFAAAAAATTLTPIWRSGMISDGAGASHIAVADMNRDGVADIVACSDGAAYVLTADGTGGYKPIWFSDNVGCTKVAVGDANHDGQPEIYVLSGAQPYSYSVITESLYVFTTDSFRPIRSVTLGQAGYQGGTNDMLVADVDGDGQLEIVTTKSGQTTVFNATTLLTKWQAAWGGTALAVGDFDGDGAVEILVNSNPAYFLDAKNQSLKWAYSGGFQQFAAGDVDGDGKAEVVATNMSWGAVVKALDATTGVAKWTNTATGFSPGFDAVAIADVNGDGKPDVVVGNDQWGSIYAIRGTDGSSLWSVSNPNHGVSSIAAGDFDGDGVTEVIWGSGSSGGGANLYVADSVKHAIEWTSVDLDGPLHVQVQDLDADGHAEVVVASTSTNGGYNTGTLMVLDAATHKQLWSIQDTSSLTISRVAVGQLDSDAGLEIAEFGSSWSNPSIEVYDYAKRQHEWSSGALPGSVTAATIANLGGSIDKIIVGLSNSTVQVFNGASAILSWVSPALDGQPYDLSVASVDGSGAKILAVITNKSVYLYDTSTWTLLRQIPATNGFRVALAPQESSHPALVVAGTAYSPYNVTAYNVATGAQVWQCTLPNPVRSLAAIAVGAQGMLAVGGDQGLLRVLPLSGDVCGSAENYDRPAGSIGEIRFADADGDGKPDLITASESMVEVDHITSSTGTVIGDVNGDQVITASDVFYLVNYLFASGAAPIGSADANGDSAVTAADIFYLINYLFAAGPAPK